MEQEIDQAEYEALLEWAEDLIEINIPIPGGQLIIHRQAGDPVNKFFLKKATQNGVTVRYAWLQQ